MVQFQNIFNNPRRNPQPSSPPPLSQPLATTNLLSLWIFLFQTFHIKGIIQLAAFSAWLLTLSVMFLRFIMESKLSLFAEDTISYIKSMCQ